MTQLRTIRSAPLDAPTTRDNGDHWTATAACITPAGIQAHADAINFPKSLIADKEAKAFCTQCPHTTRCLTEYDLTVPDGVIGGRNERERAARRGKIKRPYFRAARNRGAA